MKLSKKDLIELLEKICNSRSVYNEVLTEYVVQTSSLPEEIEIYATYQIKKQKSTTEKL